MPQELAVLVLPGEPRISILLRQRCKPVGRVETVKTLRDGKIRAAEWDGTVVQELYQRVEVTSNSFGRSSRKVTGYDVRFWKCGKESVKYLETATR
jgi:hypothetical protein